MKQSLKAFVLMPFDPEFKPIYDDLIKPALEDAGYDVARADSFLDQQNILRDIVRRICGANLIVADLTSLNPNVLYELGLCHGLKIPTILLAQSMEEVPFDLRSYRVQIYSTRFDQVHKLKQSIKEIGEKQKIGEITFGSPVTDFLPEAGSRLKHIGKPVENLVERTTHEVEEEKGILDYIVESSEAAQEIGSIFVDISQETISMTNKLKINTERVNALGQSPGPGTAAEFRKIALMVASDMTKYSEKLDEILPRFEKNVDILTESSTRYIAWIEPRSEEERETFAKFRKTIAELLEVTKGSLEGNREYREAILRLKGLSMDINRAIPRLTQSLNGITSSMEKIEAFCVRTLPLMDEKL